MSFWISVAIWASGRVNARTRSARVMIPASLPSCMTTGSRFTPRSIMRRAASVAELLGRTVIAGPFEATTIGNILMQAVALGELESLQEARAVVRGHIGRLLPSLADLRRAFGPIVRATGLGSVLGILPESALDRFRGCLPTIASIRPST